ncbi:MAG: serine/threonine-protein kinase [Acidobacteriota bacterium]
MTPDRWQRIKRILDDVGAAPAARRQAMIERACEGDASLLLDVQTFLELDDDVDDFIETPLWAFHRKSESVEEEAIEPSKRRVGPYRIQRLLGRGGMGSVYLADREDDYEQQVALKLVTWGADSEELLSRFYNERQILAHLQHPGIARLLDGGTFDDGIPYFVMEYVEGEPIDTYCDRHEVPLRRRLDLFCEVCETVDFAHQNLIVHRDLKANNILVTEDGSARLLDFGIAKLLEPDSGSPAFATLSGYAPMTPAYASPEQILSQPITTACDVYALGVLLYRLLTGHLPFHVKSSSYAEMVQAVCLSDPERPSTRVRQELLKEGARRGGARRGGARRGGARRGGARRLHRRLRGDLDAIILKAMRKEPRDRYGSVAQLVADIRRYQNGLPVRARRGSWLYTSKKFVRRNRVGLLIGAMLFGFAVSTTTLWRQADRERAEAVRAQKRAETATRFLENLFLSADPDRTRGEDLTVREVVDQGEASAAEELGGDLGLQAHMLGILSTVYRKLGLFDDAIDLSQQALRLRRQDPQTDPARLATDINKLASSLYATGNYQQASYLFEEALTMLRRLGKGGDTIDSILVNLAASLARQGQFREAEALYLEALELRRELFGPEDRNVATSLYSLGSLYLTTEDFEAGEPLLREALAIRSELLGTDHTQVAQVRDALGLTLHLLGRSAEARSLLERALETYRQRLGDQHAVTAGIKRNLAALMIDTGEVEAGGRLAQEALDALHRTSPDDASAIANVQRVLGAHVMLQGDYARAEILLLESYETLARTRGAASHFARDAKRRLSALYEAWNRPELAAKYRTEVAANQRRSTRNS